MTPTALSIISTTFIEAPEEQGTLDLGALAASAPPR
jgi:hypothetical protein